MRKTEGPVRIQGRNFLSLLMDLAVTSKERWGKKPGVWKLSGFFLSRKCEMRKALVFYWVDLAAPKAYGFTAG